MLAQPEEHLKKLEAEAIYDTHFREFVVGMRNTGPSTSPIGPDFLSAANLCTAVKIAI